MFDFLRDNLLIICPNSYKKEILTYLTEHKLILNIKFMTLDEYIKKIKFDYDYQTINYLVLKGMKVENAINYLKNLYYIEDREYHNEKLDYLVKLKKELDENNLLIYDSFFKKMLTNYQILIYGYGRLDKWTLNLFNNYEILNYSHEKEKFDVYSFNTLNQEIEFVMQSICSLIYNGIDINKISIMNIDEEYLPSLKRYAMFYHLPISLTDNDSLIGTEIGKDFINYLNLGLTRDEIFEKIKKYQDNDNYASFVNLLNNYCVDDLSNYKEQIIYDLKNSKIKTTKYDNTIQIKNVFDYVEPCEYIFLVNFNNHAIPNISLDIDYITDNIKDLVSLPKTLEINKLSKENTINYLKSIKNLTISYKNKSAFNTYYPSILLDEMEYELKEFNPSFTYSDMANKSMFTMYLDDYLKYGVKNINLDLLYSTYGKNNYLKYRNDYTKIDNNLLMEYLNNSLTLSYSSIDNYFKCGFKYYLANILNVNLYEETFMTIIGNLFHYVLSHMNDDDFELDRVYNKYLEDRVFTNKEQFFIEKLKKDLEFIIETIKKHQFITGFTKMLYEEKIDIELKNSPYVHFKGFVDKIMYKEKDNETLVSIIDYKTGNVDIDIKNLEFGLSMQLPVYLYLVKKSNLFPNMQIVGFYLQNILDINVKKDHKHSVDTLKYNNLKLRGYTLDDINKLSIFDSTYENSEMIKSMKLKQDGTFSSNSKVLTGEEIKKIIELTSSKINEAMENILKGNFNINPKVLDGENVSCNYCKFKDICYFQEENLVYLKRKEEDYAKVDSGSNDGD